MKIRKDDRVYYKLLFKYEVEIKLYGKLILIGRCVINLEGRMLFFMYRCNRDN